MALLRRFTINWRGTKERARGFLCGLPKDSQSVCPGDVGSGCGDLGGLIKRPGATTMALPADWGPMTDQLTASSTRNDRKPEQVSGETHFQVLAATLLLSHQLCWTTKKLRPLLRKKHKDFGCIKVWHLQFRGTERQLTTVQAFPMQIKSVNCEAISRDVYFESSHWRRKGLRGITEFLSRKIHLPTTSRPSTVLTLCFWMLFFLTE